MQAFDRYAYTNNNPIRYNDPTGNTIPCAICAIWNSVASSWNSFWKSKNADGYGGPQAWDHNRRQSEAKNKFYDKNVNCTSGWQCVAGLMDRAYYQEDHAVITGKGLELLAKDPRLLNLQDEIEYSATKDPRYGKQDFTRPPVSGRSITFGDEGGGMLKDATHPQTWMVRAATVDADIYVTKAKEIYINYQVYDVLDLRPDWGSKERNDSGYNIATHVLGQIWHDQLGASDQMNIYAQWIAVIK
jgi:hypothetical protein